MLTEGAAVVLARGFLNHLKPPLMCGSTLGEVPFATERCNHGGGVVVCISSSYDIATENGTKRKEEPLSRDIRLLAVRDSSPKTLRMSGEPLKQLSMTSRKRYHTYLFRSDPANLIFIAICSIIN